MPQAAAGAVAVLLFVAGAVAIGDRPGFDAPGSEVAADLARDRTRIQVGCALFAAFAPFFVWFLATVSSLTSGGRPAVRCAAAVAYGCGLVFVALFLADVTSLAVAALRPENMAAAPELALLLRDFEFLAMGVTAFLGSAVLASFAILVLRERAVWPTWIGWLAALASIAYAFRVGTLFTTEGPFAADGILGLAVPVGAFAVWTLAASLVLARGVRQVDEEPLPVSRAPA